MIFGNVLAEKITLEQLVKQIRLAASANTGNYLYLPIPHKGDNFFQITISFYFHSFTTIKNLSVLPCYISINTILQRKVKKVNLVKTLQVNQVTFQCNKARIYVKYLDLYLFNMSKRNFA